MSTPRTYKLHGVKGNDNAKGKGKAREVRPSDPG